MNRRSFLLAWGAGAWTPLGGWHARGAPRVKARPTVFYANPDGRAALVRFEATGVRAPAGRMRVYDAERRLLGTAGMLGDGDVLRGELWLPLDRETNLVTELEAPGLRGVHRTTHRVRPARRWVLHWLRLRDPSDIRRAVEALPVPRGALHAHLLHATGVLANPLTPIVHPDHLAFLQTVKSAAQQASGVPVSPVALIDAPHEMWPTLPLALAGSGVRCAVMPWDGSAPLRWWQGPGGTRVLIVAAPPDGSANALGFAAQPAAMAARVERWLSLLPQEFVPAVGRTTARGAVTADAHVIVLDDHDDEQSVVTMRNVEDFNRRYAYPHITRDPGAILAWLDGAPAPAVAAAPSLVSPRGPAMADAAIDAAARAWRRQRAAHHRDLLQLAGAVFGLPPSAPPRAALEAMAAGLDTPFPGALVFNPAPVRRTDVVVMPGGTEFVVTDVPPWGYAYVAEAEWKALPPSAASLTAPAVAANASGRVQTPLVTVALDDASGAITSFVTGGREWVLPGSDGLNAVPGAIVERIEQRRVAGVGTRITLQRWSPARGVVRSGVTVYDALPWVDVENDAEALGGRPMQYYFHWRLANPRVAWDIPAGARESPIPVQHAGPRRWVRLDGVEGTALVACDPVHRVAVLEPAVMESATTKRVRYRLWASAAGVGPERAWALGYGTEPFSVAPVVGGGRRLPRFGSLLQIEPDTVLPVGIVPGADGTAVVYLLNTGAAPQYAAVSAGVVRFERARMVDFRGREAGPVAGSLSQGVLVAVPAHGAVAVRLEGLGLYR